MAFKKSLKIDELVALLDDDVLCDASQGSCTNGYDNDGSTGYEIFENGFDLGREAGRKSVFESDHGDSTYFFIGEEEGIIADLKSLYEDEDNRRREDEDEEGDEDSQ
jgi:hypothetical protein